MDTDEHGLGWRRSFTQRVNGPAFATLFICVHLCASVVSTSSHWVNRAPPWVNRPQISASPDMGALQKSSDCAFLLGCCISSIQPRHIRVPGSPFKNCSGAL